MLTSQKNCCIPVPNKMQKFMSISKLIVLICNILFNFLLHVNIQYMISFCTYVVCRHMFSVASPNNLQIGTQAFVSYGTPVL